MTSQNHKDVCIPQSLKRSHDGSSNDHEEENQIPKRAKYGQGVEKNFDWFHKRAEQGHAVAQYNLGYFYENGQGVAMNLDLAFHWFQKSAEQGHAVAQYNLGYCYENGAVYWYEKSAEQGNASAQINLGYCYEYGYGIEMDFESAFYWYKKSADQGNATAQYNLGICYQKGQGGEINLDLAFHWFQKSAEQGDVDARRHAEVILLKENERLKAKIAEFENKVPNKK